jgi:hypothetical protein
VSPCCPRRVAIALASAFGALADYQRYQAREGNTNDGCACVAGKVMVGEQDDNKKESEHATNLKYELSDGWFVHEKRAGKQTVGRLWWPCGRRRRKRC